MGPSAIRHAGLHERLRSLGNVTEDAGNVDIPERATLAAHPDRSFLSAVVDGCTAAYDAGVQAIRDDRFPIFLAEVPGGAFYGLPAIDGRGIKIARHYGAPEVDSPDGVES